MACHRTLKPSSHTFVGITNIQSSNMEAERSMDSSIDHPRLAGRGCWTCKDRKIRCDRGLPSCQNCTRMQHQCQGYGVRLSWPKGNNPKRAVVYAPIGASRHARAQGRLHFVHTNYRDMALYEYLSGLHQSVDITRTRLQPKELTHPLLTEWKSSPQGAEEGELLRYFSSVAFSSLAIFGPGLTSIPDWLMASALSSNAPPHQAVRYALMAIASLHRYGLQQQALQYKISAIEALGESTTRSDLSVPQGFLLVAVCMLLCTFEIHIASETTGQWLVYLCGSGKIIKAMNLERHSYDGEAVVTDILAWVHYHGILAEFSIFHWRHGVIESVFGEGFGLDAPIALPCDKLRRERQLQFSTSHPSHAMLCLLAEGFYSLYDYQELMLTSEEYYLKLSYLKSQTEIINIPLGQIGESSATHSNNLEAITKLLQLGTLIFMHRITEPLQRDSDNLAAWQDCAFAILKSLDTCQHLFPLFIVGIEARTEERRADFLDLLERTGQKTNIRDLGCFQATIVGIWNQDDLSSDESWGLNYTHKLSGVISSNHYIPSLA